jgi:pimeloyl-ACP methyl ester carboxylesterase
MSHVVGERKHIVLITHGIFSQGAWSEDLRKALEEKGLEAKALRYPTVYLLQFWMPEFLNRFMVAGLTRERAMQHLLKEILSYTADKYEISVIAHSFGTWIIANILRRYPAIRFRRVALVGSIVPEDFPWNEIVGRNIDINCVLNNVGRKDMWPPSANMITWGYGPTGTFGFGKAHVIDKYHDVGHSDLLNYDFARDYLAPFLVDGTINEPTTEAPEHRLPKILDFLKFTKWLCLFAVLYLFVWPYIQSHFLPEPVAHAPVTLFPDWKTWDKLIDPIKPNDDAARKLQVRLDKWKTYVAKGAQPWLTSEDNMADPTMGFGWFEKELATDNISTFTYIFETDNQNIAIKEVYAFLTANLDSDGYLPIYAQMKPTVERYQQAGQSHVRGRSGLMFALFVKESSWPRGG